MQDSSFHTDGTELVARPRKGVKPGEALADLLFSLLLSPILARISSELDDLGLLLRPVASTHIFAQDDSPEPVTDATFADDTAFMVVLASVIDHQQARSSLSTAAGVIHRALASKGLIPNYGKGKSGVLLHVHGPSSRSFRRHCMIEHSVVIQVDRSSNDVILVVDSYKHLGTTAASNAASSVSAAALQLTPCCSVRD